jgi:hypothetical protein
MLYTWEKLKRVYFKKLLLVYIYLFLFFRKAYIFNMIC